ncbi:hypothetical protein [Nocardia arizonensis]|uniref:hypothetical protein n=1 Tax=Nocardia arizonensis TaxID=1141647 RepID=UPI0006D22CE8|nr:hypothetical protein [Nocardia arizonensis]
MAEFDVDDRAEASHEIRNALALTVTAEDPDPLREVLHTRATTAAVMRDPARRAVRTESASDSDFTGVEPPHAAGDV